MWDLQSQFDNFFVNKLWNSICIRIIALKGNTYIYDMLISEAIVFTFRCYRWIEALINIQAELREQSARAFYMIPTGAKRVMIIFKCIMPTYYDTAFMPISAINSVSKKADFTLV